MDAAALRQDLDSCLIENDDIELEAYLRAHGHLQTLCGLLGSVFSYVEDEIRSKVEAVRVVLKTHPSKFTSIKTMIQYETENKLLKEPNYVNGSRSTLRLHWGLNFLRVFLRRVYELDLEDSTVQAGNDAYNSTMFGHHTWYVKIGARLAMSFLPKKAALLKMVNGGNEDFQALLDLMVPIIDLADAVYDRTEAIYAENGLLRLP